MSKSYDRQRGRERLSSALNVFIGIFLTALLLLVFLSVWFGCLFVMFFVVGFCLFGLADVLGWVLPQVDYFARLVTSGIVLSILVLIFKRKKTEDARDPDDFID